MSLEESVKKFVALAGHESLSKGDLAEIRNLMKILKKEGMSNLEISELSDGRWSESTVKGYTTGVKASSAASWQNAANLLNEVVVNGMSLDDIKNAAVVSEFLEGQGIELDEVVDFMQTAGSFSISFIDLIQQHLVFKETGVSPYKAAELLEAKNNLEAKGISLDSLKQLSELAGKFGDAQNVFEALSSFGSLKEVEVKIDEAEKKLENVHKETASADQKLQETKNKLAELAKPLATFNNLLALGFDEKQLDDLGGLTEKYGGPEAVFQAVRGYADYTELTNKILEAESKLDDLRAGINKLDSEYGHLKSAITMCDSLIHEHQFGLDAIVTILSIAGKYGQPINVLKVLDTYGSLKILSDKQCEVEGQVQGKEKLLLHIEGRNQAALEQLESLQATILKVGAEVTELKLKLAGSKLTAQMISFVNNPESAGYSEYGHVVVVFAEALYKWVRVNDHKFKFTNIESGLKSLVTELGGD